MFIIRQLIDVYKRQYIGTPCQIAGLKAFLQKEYKKLYTIDLICHGVYSYRLLQKEVDYWSCKFNRGKVSNFRFRSKEKYPWIYGCLLYTSLDLILEIRSLHYLLPYQLHVLSIFEHMHHNHCNLVYYR